MRISLVLTIAVITAVCPAQANSRQTLNLDFEELSIEGMSRPWGWNLTAGAAASVSMDGIVKQNGNFSLKMKTTPGGGVFGIADF
jgi:hypothetical protein